MFPSAPENEESGLNDKDQLRLFFSNWGKSERGSLKTNCIATRKAISILQANPQLASDVYDCSDEGIQILTRSGICFNLLSVMSLPPLSFFLLADNVELETVKKVYRLAPDIMWRIYWVRESKQAFLPLHVACSSEGGATLEILSFLLDKGAHAWSYLSSSYGPKETPIFFYITRCTSKERDPEEYEAIADVFHLLWDHDHFLSGEHARFHGTAESWTRTRFYLEMAIRANCIPLVAAILTRVNVEAILSRGIDDFWSEQFFFRFGVTEQSALGLTRVTPNLRYLELEFNDFYNTGHHTGNRSTYAQIMEALSRSTSIKEVTLTLPTTHNLGDDKLWVALLKNNSVTKLVLKDERTNDLTYFERNGRRESRRESRTKQKVSVKFSFLKSDFIAFVNSLLEVPLLRDLEIEVRSGVVSVRRKEGTQAVISLLKQERLENLQLLGVSLDMELLCKHLENNTTLKQLTLDLVHHTDPHRERLLEVLKNHNTTLAHFDVAGEDNGKNGWDHSSEDAVVDATNAISVHYSDDEESEDVHTDELWCYLKLNGYGRQQVRDHTMSQKSFCDQVASVVGTCQARRDLLKLANLIYMLLRESPALWASEARGRKRGRNVDRTAPGYS